MQRSKQDAYMLNILVSKVNTIPRRYMNPEPEPTGGGAMKTKDKLWDANAVMYGTLGVPSSLHVLGYFIS